MDIPYQKLEKIGAGSFSTVYKGIHKETKQLVAIKILNLDTAEDEVQDIRTEIALLTQLKLADVQNVTRYYGCHLYGSKLWIIMDYCHGGSIRTLMEAGRFEEKYIAIIMREVLLALAYVHKCGIIHRDIKAANILMANDGRIQLCDFGVATQLAANHLKRNTFVGTPYWMAPEVITEGSMYNFKADIWSLGITVYEIATGRPPFADQEQMRALFLIPRSPPARLEGSNYTPQIKEFLGLCLQLAPDQRPTADELSKTRFIKGTSKIPVSTLRDLIVRYAKWQEAGGVRQSIMISNRRGSSVSNDENEVDIDPDGEVIAWDFDTSFDDIPLPFSAGKALLATSSIETFDDTLSISDTVQSRPLRTALGTTSNVPVPVPPSGPSTSEHPLEQLFNDPGTIRSAAPPPVLRPRKDTTPSRPVSPLPPLTTPVTQSASPDTAAFDIRLPSIPSATPIQIQIPTPEETLVKLPPSGGRSRSATVTRSARSDSVGSGAHSRTPRHAPADPMPQPPSHPHSPPRMTHVLPPKAQPPPLPVTVSTSVSSTFVLKGPPPLPSPKMTPAAPAVPPASPTKSHIASKSLPNNILAPTVPVSVAALQEHNLVKGRSTELKPSRPPNLVLNIANQAAVLPPELSPRSLSPSHGRFPDLPSGALSTTPTITAIPPSPTPFVGQHFTLPPLAPLNLAVLTESPGPANGAGRLLADELQRILRGFSAILDVIGNGLSALEAGTRDDDADASTLNDDNELVTAQDNDEIRDRLDSLTSSFTSGGTLVTRRT